MSIPDPLAREAVAQVAAAEWLAEALGTARARRDDTIRKMHAYGIGYGRIATVTGLTKRQVQSIITERNPDDERNPASDS